MRIKKFNKLFNKLKKIKLLLFINIYQNFLKVSKSFIFFFKLKTEIDFHFI